MLTIFLGLSGQALNAPIELPSPPSLQPLVAAASFPREAFRHSPNHRITVSVVVGADGRVAHCDVVESTGDAAVDSTTCQSIAKEARFSPPKGPDGSGTSIHFNSTIALGVRTGRSYEVLRLFRFDDYPEQALRRGEQGTVGYEIQIGADGRVVDCVISQTSGSAALDQKTCEVIRQRARFKPPRDEAGAPATSADSGVVSWLIPG